TGLAAKQLQIVLPEATFLDWVDKADLPALYRRADLLLLPSRFDTFGCVVLEALTCGLPVIAYHCKGPKDIIEDKVSGYLVENSQEMAKAIIDYCRNPAIQTEMQNAAILRSQQFKPEIIMTELLKNAQISAFQDNAPHSQKGSFQ
ncbi:MAG: glycosyltransferase, partial [Pseudomonadales bacterium]